MAADAKRSKTPWWKAVEVAPDRSLEFSIGTLRLMLGHGQNEWLLGLADEAGEEVTRARPRIRRRLPETVDERYVYAGDSNQVTLTPLLADRPVVIRPNQPVFLLSGQTITLYLSTPVWLKIEIGSPPVLLKEFPVVRLSDTWFGPSTRVGELCYAGRTHAWIRLGDLPQRPHRAITPLEIRNDSSSPLPLEKISLPVPMLSLYGGDNGSLWTQRVSLTREGQSDLATVKIESRLPEAETELSRLAGPREEGSRSGMTRAFSLLFGSS